MAVRSGARRYLRQRNEWLGCDEAARWMELMQKSDDPVYGAGLRMVLASYQAFCATLRPDSGTTGAAADAADTPTGDGASTTPGGHLTGKALGVSTTKALPRFMRYLHKHGRLPPAPA